jgi:hypothetical protein
VTVQSARYSNNGKLVIVIAHETHSRNDFVLVCTIDEGNCSFPKVGAAYHVISVFDSGHESWGLRAVGQREEVTIFSLVYAGSK